MSVTCKNAHCRAGAYFNILPSTWNKLQPSLRCISSIPYTVSSRLITSPNLTHLLILLINLFGYALVFRLCSVYVYRLNPLLYFTGVNLLVPSFFQVSLTSTSLNFPLSMSSFSAYKLICFSLFTGAAIPYIIFIGADMKRKLYCDWIFWFTVCSFCRTGVHNILVLFCLFFCRYSLNVDFIC